VNGGRGGRKNGGREGEKKVLGYGRVGD